jgi:hypothetical protein
MAYYNKYKFTFATRANKTAYLYLQEDLGSAPAVIEYLGVDINLQYLPNSDDPFEPIYASQLSVTIDVTDNLDNVPDFVSNNDRKYFVKLFLGDDLEWVGYTLNDNIQISFSTGRKQMSFNAVDGIGMLASIPIYTTNVNNITNNVRTLLTYMLTALNSLNFPTNLNLITVCSYYATGMTTRASGTQYEPFNQTYLPVRTFKNQDYTYDSCYDVLIKIIRSFGCRLFQAGGKWWIVAVNEFANENNFFTEYNSAGSVVTSGSNLNTLSTIQPYTSNTSGLYFIDNSQMKLFLKGFNRINLAKDINYDKNLIDNGNFMVYNTSPILEFQSFFIYNTGAGSTFTYYDWSTSPARLDFVTIDIVYVGGGGSTTIDLLNLPKVSASVNLTYSMLFKNANSPISNAFGRLKIKVIGTSSTYYLLKDVDDKPYWNLIDDGNGYLIPGFNVGNDGSAFTITLPKTKNDGQLYISWINDGLETCSVTNFNLTSSYIAEKQEFNAFINSSNQYIKQIDLPYGFVPTTEFPTAEGELLSSTSTALQGWTRYGKAYTGGSLNELILQQQINCFAKKIINIDGSVSSFVTTNANYPNMNASKLIKATDTDPVQISVANKPYMLGNCTIEYVNNSISATLLEISNTDIEATIDKFTYYKFTNE